MEGDRWTCEACGCHTNQASDRTCTICGTSNTGPSFFRRAAAAAAAAGGGGVPGGYAAAAARAGWFAARVSGRQQQQQAAAAAAGARNHHHHPHDQLSAVDDFWDSVEQAAADVVYNQNHHPHPHAHHDPAMAAAAAAAAAAEGANSLMMSRVMESRFLEAARAFSNLEQHAAAAAQAQAAVAQAQQQQSIAVAQAAVAAQQQQQRVVIINPTEVLRAATVAAAEYPNAHSFQWANPSTLLSTRQLASASSSLSSSSSGIRVHDNLAHVPLTAAETGRAIRVTNPMQASSTFGFRVAFDHPGCTNVGDNMGGCYLVGVTTSSFTQYGEANALQSSPFFYGIEDCGRKYEGGRRAPGNVTSTSRTSSLVAAAVASANSSSNNSSSNSNNNNSANSNNNNPARGLRRTTAGSTGTSSSSMSPFAIELSPTEVPFNSANVLFGCQEVITVIYHSGTLTFWRDDVCLGTLLTNLPRAAASPGSGILLYPTVVPFNRGVTVAITGMDVNPVPLLRAFAADWIQAHLDQDNQKRRRLAQERSLLIHNGRMTPRLRQVLTTIFSQYCHSISSSSSSGSPGGSSTRSGISGSPTSSNHEMATLSFVAAARLWYRCGMKLSCLKTLLESHSRNYVILDDFLLVIERILAEDEIVAVKIIAAVSGAVTGASSSPSSGSPQGGSGSISTTALGLLEVPCQIGDKVELVVGYEKYGDATGGPLQPGDRGVVVDTQNGPSGERRSVRVLFSGRRWWYQPQAIVSERSGLIETPGVWFLRSLLRVHAYDHLTLTPLDQVSKSASAIGDWVKPKSVKNHKTSCGSPLCGRVVAESACSSPPRGSSRDTGNTVPVEFLDKGFAEACGVKLAGSDAAASGLVTRRVRTNKLVYCSPLHLVGIPSSSEPSSEVKTEDSSRNLSDRLLTEIAALSRLDRSALDFIAKECEKSSEAMASLFAGGLPSAVLTSIDVAERQMASLEPREDLPEKICAIGKLSQIIANQLFYTETAASSPVKEEPRTSSRVSSEQVGEPARASLSSSPSHASAAPPAVGAVARESPSTGGGRRAPPRRLRVREIIARRDPSRRVGGGDDPAASHSVAALQQRRHMLLSLMSRSRRGNSSLHNELIERESAIFGSELPPAPPILGAMHDAFSFVQNPLDGSWDESVSDHATDSPSSSDQQPKSLLDSILRCRADSDTPGARASTSQAVFLRNLVSTGLMADNVVWLKACTDAQAKKVQLSSSQKSLTLLKGLVDEEGTPLLLLAISLGCSPDVLNYLISRGSTVEKTDIEKAARTDQAETLALLLKHTSYCEDVVSAEYSASVQRVFAEAKARQEQLDQKMRDEAGAFMVRLLRRLLRFGLKARRRRSPRVELCSKAIAEIIVGNVLLRSLQTTQKSGVGNAPSRDEEDDVDPSLRDGGEDDSTDYYLATEGLMGLLPNNILGEALLSEAQYATSFLGLIEDFLCSKDMNDSATGLALLSTLLIKFPELRLSGEMQRFGMLELVSFHDELASSRIADIQSRQTRNPGSPSLPDKSGHAVFCPNKHTAVLFVTRHSSFRCDICGNGVDCGRPMHGCRECDWDVCEVCTDKSQSGIDKCGAIRELAATSRRLLTEDPSNSETSISNVDFMSQNDCSYELHRLTVRLRNRDVRALRDIGLKLLTPGTITIHQFLSVVLPSLHSAFISRTDDDGLLLHSESAGGRRCKKARVVDGLDDLSLESPEDKLKFCKHSIRLLVTGNDESACSGGDSKKSSKPVAEESDSPSSDSHDETQDDSGDGDPEARSGNNEVVKFSESFQELLRRLHQVLALHERVDLISSLPEDVDTSNATEHKGGDLQTLTKAIEIRLSPSKFGSVASSVSSTSESCVQAEPLLPIEDLSLHVLRTCRSSDRKYVEFCEDLARDKAIIVERPLKEGGTWRIAEVVAFDDCTCAHTVRYACSLPQGREIKILFVNRESPWDLDDVRFDDQKETLLVLAARQYFIMHRRPPLEGERSPVFNDSAMDVDVESLSSESLLDSSGGFPVPLGSRIECRCGAGGSWTPYTLIVLDSDQKGTVVSDEGVVVKGVISSQVRSIKKTRGSHPISREIDSRIPAWARDDRGGINAAFPFISANRQRSDSTREIEGSQDPDDKLVLKRTWSALTLADSTRPVDLKFDGVQSVVDQTQFNFKVQIGEEELILMCDSLAIERPRKLSVKFSLHEKLPGCDFSVSRDMTFIGVLRHLQVLHDKNSRWNLEKSVQLFYSLETGSQNSHIQPAEGFTSVHSQLLSESALIIIDDHRSGFADLPATGCRSRKFSSRSLTGSVSEDDDGGSGLCGGLDEICIQCMEAISLLSEFAHENAVQSDRDVPVESLFANSTLSKKLSDQLDDALVVVGKALPEWCTLAPSFAPRVFSYESRRLLLERFAFGVSRSILKQQEAKINVGRLRQRMASLRARAVELVGEAFSGGAEDPTALQLQADELYGMEEALAARVRAAFRAVKWQEHVLQVAKAVVRREHLLADAAAVMQRFAESDVCHRRLEVRFDGESGFDAASGNEAGVTRGFYADIAESLLSTENVAGVYCATSCSYGPSAASLKLQPMDVDAAQQEASKLPLWIPDFDTSAQVVIPTPRTDERSAPGVFPRPLPNYHPQLPQILECFRFMGRLFAAAIRDGFMFPLPLSSSFLKLVQRGYEVASSLDSKAASHETLLLTSADLPRAGFLGGEVYAAESYICKALDSVDAADPPLSGLELERRYKEIATDRKFARVALGKLFDCSFEDYFQDRTFVDPLDPTQGEDAVPLCPNGYRKHVTIYNVREWVALSKHFILHDGVIAQALAFRRGVEDFFSADYLRLFTPEELQRDVCGVGDNVDNWDEAAVRKLFKLDGGKGAAEALVAVAAIGGEGGAALSRRFGPSSPTISFLVKALVEASPKQRRQFLNFVTSVPIVTPGRIEVVPVVSPSGEFVPMQDPSCLPRANTCARRLYLPKFETHESFCQVLWAVVREESKFKGFFEWRGN